MKNNLIEKKSIKPIINSKEIKYFPKTKDTALAIKKLNKNYYLLEFEECFILIRSNK